MKRNVFALGLLLLSAFPVMALAGEQDPVHWIAAVTAKRIAAGGTFDVSVTATIEEEWHVYSISQGPGGPIPTTIAIPADQPFSRAGAIRGPQPVTAFDQNFDIQTETYDTTVTLTVPVRATASRGTLRLVVGYQACTNRLCLPPRTETLTVAVGGPTPAAGNANAKAPTASPQAARIPRSANCHRRHEHSGPASRPGSPASGARASRSAGCASCVRSGGGLVGRVSVARDDDGGAVAVDAVRLPDGAHHRVLLHQPRGVYAECGDRIGRDLRPRDRAHVHRPRKRGGSAGRRGRIESLCGEPVGQSGDRRDVHRVCVEPVRPLRSRAAVAAALDARRRLAPAGHVDGRHAADGADVHDYVAHVHGGVPRHAARRRRARGMAAADRRAPRLLGDVRPSVRRPGRRAAVRRASSRDRDHGSRASRSSWDFSRSRPR